MKLRPTDDLTIEVTKGDAPAATLYSLSQIQDASGEPGVLTVWGDEIHPLIRGLQAAAVALGIPPEKESNAS